MRAVPARTPLPLGGDRVTTSPRRYPDRPLVGVGAVLLPPELDRVVLIQRGAPPAEGLWSFPGGLANAGESLRQACIREVHEETGLEVEVKDLAKVVERILPDDQGRIEYHFVILDFWGTVPASEEPRAGSDAKQVRWVTMEELDSLATTRGVPEAIQRALQLARGEPTTSPLFGSSSER
jgi:8-oxo-dGTP diphosphatase